MNPPEGKNDSPAMFHSAVIEGERKLLFSGANTETVFTQDCPEEISFQGGEVNFP
jgi:hypothetical protein